MKGAVRSPAVRQDAQRTALVGLRAPGKRFGQCLGIQRPTHLPPDARRCGLVVPRAEPSRAASALATIEPQQSTAVALHQSPVSYLFVVPSYVTEMGQELKVVGGLPELGDWVTANAPTMHWCPGHRWELEITLPKCQAFEFKVVMTQGSFTRWEKDGNRLVESDLEADRRLSRNGGQSSEPVEIIVQVDCAFDQTSETKLALRMPKTKIEEAYEVAKAALEMLDMRRKKLQTEVDEGVAPHRHLELSAMGDALALQSKSVQALSQLAEAADSDQDSVQVPIGRVRLPAGASLTAIAQLAMTSFESNTNSLDEVAATEAPLLTATSSSSVASAAAAIAAAANAAAAAANAAAVAASSSDEEELLDEKQAAAAAAEAAAVAETAAAAAAAAVAAAVAAEVYDTAEAAADESSIAAPQTVVAQAEAAAELSSVSQKLKEFFAKNPTPDASQMVDSSGVIDPSTDEQVMELTSLMAVAEQAWERARSLSSYEEPAASQSGEMVFRFDEPALQEQLTQAATFKLLASSKLNLMRKSASGSVSSADGDDESAEQVAAAPVVARRSVREANGSTQLSEAEAAAAARAVAIAEAASAEASAAYAAAKAANGAGSGPSSLAEQDQEELPAAVPAVSVWMGLLGSSEQEQQQQLQQWRRERRAGAAVAPPAAHSAEPQSESASAAPAMQIWRALLDLEPLSDGTDNEQEEEEGSKNIFSKILSFFSWPN